MKTIVPFPIIVSDILPAQYSCFHHSTRRLLVSLPILPPSASCSLEFDSVDGAGDVPRDESGEAVRAGPSCTDKFWYPLLAVPLTDFDDLAASVKLALFPLPNLCQGCPGLVRCLFNWNIRQASEFKFFLFSESTAFNSLLVQLGEKRGEWKNPENRARAPENASVLTEK